MWRRLVPVVCAVLLAPGSPLVWSPTPARAQPDSFTFGVAGDFGATSNTSATLNALAGAGTDFFLAAGDLSYNQVTPESAWCDFVKTRVGTTFPFELSWSQRFNVSMRGPESQSSNSV